MSLEKLSCHNGPFPEEGEEDSTGMALPPERKPKFLLVCDFDDTLTGCRDGIEEFNRLIESSRGVYYLVYSSGRFKDSLLSGFASEGLISPDALTANVGTEIYYPPFRGRDPEWEKIVGVDWDRGAVESALEVLSLKPQPYGKRFVLSYYLADRKLPAEIDRRLKNSAVRIIHTKEKFLDVLPAAGGKGNAARYLAEKLGLPLIGCGDSENDLDLLEEADFGILVGNSEEALKEKFARDDKSYLAAAGSAAGVVEGLRHLEARWSGLSPRLNRMRCSAFVR